MSEGWYVPVSQICPDAKQTVYGTEPGDRGPREVHRPGTFHDFVIEAKGPIVCRWCRVHVESVRLGYIPLHEE